MGNHEVLVDAAQASGMEHAEVFARRLAARDQSAWEQAFELHYTTVFGFVRSRLRGAGEAEDLASHVFEVGFARANRFDWRGIPIEAWLIGIARNLVRDHIKKLGRRGYHAELDASNEPSAPDATATVVLRYDLQRAMQHLTEDQQEVLTLRFLLDRSVEDSARLMNRSEDAVKNLQRRALAAMQRALVAQGYPGVGR